MSSVDSRVVKLEKFVDDFLNGAYLQPPAIGPNTLSKNTIKSKSITSAMMNVSNLQAVNADTGSLSISGTLTMGSAGSIQSGKTSYSDTTHAGYWIGIDSGTAKIRVGNSGHTSGWTWDGSTLAITGTITATTGTIGGFTITANRLAAGSGSSSVGLDSSGGSTPLIFAGSATPSSAPFRVTPAGDMTATSGAIGGLTIDGLNGLLLGTGGTTRGISTGSTAFYAGNATPGSAPFRVTTAGALTATNATITGAITATSGSFSGAITASSLSITGSASFSGGSLTLPGGGSLSSSTFDINSGTMASLTVDGTITIGSGGSIVDGDGSTWTQTGLTLVSSGSFGDSIVWKVSGVDKASIYASSGNAKFEYSGGGLVQLTSSSAILIGDLNNRVTVNTGAAMVLSATNDIKVQLGDTGGTYAFYVTDSSQVSQFGVNSNGDLIRPIANDSTALGAYYGRIPIFINGNLRYLAVYN